MRDGVIKKIASLYCIGRAPIFPGTLASLVALILVLTIGSNSPLYLILVLFSIIMGFLVCGKSERIYGKVDPSEVVIDEFCGMLLALLFVKQTVLLILLGFIIFRLLDILKPFPINEAQKLKGSSGIMLDDILSGIFANLILKVLEVGGVYF